MQAMQYLGGEACRSGFKNNTIFFVLNLDLKLLNVLSLTLTYLTLTDVNGQNGAFPPPPWEAQPVQGERLAVQVPQAVSSDQTGGTQPNFMQTSQFVGIQPQPLQNAQYSGSYPPVMQNSQVGGTYYQPLHGRQFPGMIPQQQQQQQQTIYGGQMMGHGYGHQPAAQFYDQMGQSYPYGSPYELSQRMFGMSMQDNSSYTSTGPSYTHVPSSNSSLQQLRKPSNPEDKLFGDLVSLAKSKPGKPGVNKVMSS